uniref:Uncharacterized protein n=1 Tax=Cajanus cajan TaxID=3821 RepID=A0A151RUC1_CAJCA|nr:hypothetical protein KK1_032296 [Cajanus cajan]
MAGQSRKWMILVATIWIQAFTGTNFDFSDYSSSLKSSLNISQVQLNYLATASDIGKLFGWSSGLALMYFPLSLVLLVASFMGLVGYGLQWLAIQDIITLPYPMFFLLCLLSGCSICWFNTVCFVLCIRNFPVNRPLALSLTVSFNGVSAALYTLAANSIDPSSDTLYLLLNALVPLLTSLVALVPILLQPPLNSLSRSPEAARRNSVIFLILNFLAIFTGTYLLLFASSNSDEATSRLYFGGAIFLLVSPLCIPGTIYARDWFHQAIHYSFRNGDGHSLLVVVKRLDFWLYYVAYFCGGTIGLVYSNNLGQIAQSLGQSSSISTLVTLYSAFSFFGRLLSAVPDYIRNKFYFARTGWLAIALVPTPVAFIVLAASDSAAALNTGTALIGLSSGFIFAAAVAVTSELFGPNSVSVNHNILITNIPIGSLLYGFLAALVYDMHAQSTSGDMMADSLVCMGRKCYFWTFVWWGGVSVVGLASSVLLFLRTKYAYDHFERHRISASSLS